MIHGLNAMITKKQKIMKAKIDKKGMLVIEAETETEIYALKKWNEDNPPVEKLDLQLIGNTEFNQKKEIK